MEKILYLILPVYFIIGAIVTFRVNKRKTVADRRHNWLKFSTYLVIINLLFAAVIFNKNLFQYITLVIIVFSYGELIRLTYLTGKMKTGSIALILFSFGFYFFYQFSLLDKNHLIFALVIVTVFDAFSQLTGQLLGKRKLLPLISPNKTTEGLLGGYFFSAITAIFIHNILSINTFHAIVLGLGIATFAFFGDVSASWFKRKFEVKDYSNLLPGQGGFLDRFDSLIFGGLLMYLITNYL